LARRVNELLNESDFFFQLVERYVIDKYLNKRNKQTIRITEPFTVFSTFNDQLRDFTCDFLKIKSVSRNDDEENEIRNYCNKLTAFGNTISGFLGQQFQDHVYWVEVSKGNRKNTKLCMSPINMADFFRDNIFSEKGPAIMTSATLSVDKSLEYFKRVVGAENEKDLILDSSFNFREQMTIYIARNVPEPVNNTKEKISDLFENSIYEKVLRDRIKKGIMKTKGGALVLFTNSKLMRRMYGSISDELKENDIICFAQGEGLPKTKLLKEFEYNHNSVLFGVDSFWMGIDVPGNSLRNVIITKLPFGVPDHPIVEAKLEVVQARGGNPFMEFYLPGAILKLKQGIGRLIRTKTDEGIVIILDSRILNKFYGKIFLNSLPDAEIIIE
jgi:ATP-dependent DNA helicase DinG